MSQLDTQSIQRIVHAELKKLDEKLDSMERAFADLAKTIRYDFSYIKDTNLAAKEHTLANNQNKTASAAPQDSDLASVIHQELHKIIENSLPPLISKIVHEELRQLKEELEYLKKHSPTTDSLEHATEILHQKIVKSLTPKEETPLPPFPHRPQI